MLLVNSAGLYNIGFSAAKVVHRRDGGEEEEEEGGDGRRSSLTPGNFDGSTHVSC